MAKKLPYPSQMAVPAVLYVVQNNLLFLALSKLDAAYAAFDEKELGSLETGNRTGTDPVWSGHDFDKQHFVRFGKNDGAATMAIGRYGTSTSRGTGFVDSSAATPSSACSP